MTNFADVYDSLEITVDKICRFMKILKCTQTISEEVERARKSNEV